MSLASILVVDPDVTERALVARQLRDLGHDVVESGDANSALLAARAAVPDLMLCDCSLPDLTGIDLLGDFRGSNDLRQTRVLLMSARDGSADAVRALTSGADDFVPKPLDMPELVARVDACLRRPASVSPTDPVAAGDIVIDHVGHRATVKGQPISLAPREYRLLLFLVSHQDQVFSRQQLLKQVWGRQAAVGPRTVDVHVRRLRSVLEPFGREDTVQTVRGTGYRFSLET